MEFGPALGVNYLWKRWPRGRGQQPMWQVSCFRTEHNDRDQRKHSASLIWCKGEGPSGHWTIQINNTERHSKPYLSIITVLPVVAEKLSIVTVSKFELRNPPIPPERISLDCHTSHLGTIYKIYLKPLLRATSVSYPASLFVKPTLTCSIVTSFTCSR